MSEQNDVTAPIVHASQATRSRALLKAALAVTLVLSFSLALLLDASGVAFGATSARDARAFASPAARSLGVVPAFETTPEVFSIEPSVGPTSGGTTVKIKGNGFLKGSTVAIGAEATNVEIKSETEIVAKTAAGSAGEDEVIVTHEGHASTEGPGYVYEVLPHVVSVTPNEGSTSGGTEVVITGTGFLAGSSVTIGTKVATLEYVSETELKAITSAAAAAGTHEVIVVDKHGASSAGPTFTYVSPPTVTSIAPTEGSTNGGNEVTIKGTGFVKASPMTVEIGGSDATSVTVKSSTELTAKTPSGSAGPTPVAVSDTFGKSGEATKFKYVSPPVVAGVKPAVGPTTGGTIVKITGTGFLKASTVKIGAETTGVEVKSETEILAKTAAGSAGEDAVEVTDVGGTGASGASEGFTYVTPPTITAVAPAEGSTNGGTEVVITGTGFESGSTVTIGSAATGVEVQSGTEIVAVTPTHAAGANKVVVTLPDGVSSEKTKEFTYVAPPTVASIAPTEGSTNGGNEVTIKGTGFIKTSPMTIEIGGSAATSVTIKSSTELTAKTPSGSPGESAAVVVSDGFGTSGEATKFKYVAPPTVTGIKPVAGPTTGGTVVTIKGTGFLKAATVKIGAAATNVEVKSETEIVAKTAASGSAVEDAVEVTTIGGTGSSGADEGFTYVTPPTITAIAPAEGSTNGGTEVTITGTGFESGATVTIGAPATGVEFKSSTEIVAKTAAHAAGANKVVVTLPDGVVSEKTKEFTYVTPPTVTSIAPTEGSTNGGTEVNIKGTGFVKTSPMTVEIGGNAATEVTVKSSTELTAKSASHSAGSAVVVVSDTFGKSGEATKFTYVSPPTVTSIKPAVGSTAGGTAVTVKGTGFQKSSTVKIGAAATNVEVKSETEIVAKTAAGSAGEDTVEVTDVGGTSSSGAGEGFTYITPPTITGVAPAEGSTNGGTEVVITGTGFENSSTVTIGSAATNVEVKSGTEIVAKTAVHAAGAVKIVVTLPDGVFSEKTKEFTYVAPPTVTSIAPTEGSTNGGTEVNIKGTGFVKSPTVEIGGTAATSVTVKSATELTAKTAAHSGGAVAVAVSDTFGKSGEATKFTYVAPPTVTSIKPTAGATTGGTAVTIKGTGFQKSSTVKIGAAATNVEVKSETEIVAKTAAAGSAGEVTVEVTDVGGTGSSGADEGFTYVTPPTITAIAPAEGSTNGGTEVTITGTGFESGSTVTIGSAATGLEFKSSTEIVAKTAAHAAGANKVVVTLPDGVVSEKTKEFTYVTPPTVTSITPTEGTTNGGTEVNIKGTGFIKSSPVTVEIGGTPATSVTVKSTTELTAKTPSGSPGSAVVAVSDTFGKSGEATKFTYISPPTVLSIKPAVGSTAGGTSVTIKGTSFQKTATVKIGAAATNVEVKSETEIVAKTAAESAGEDTVEVTDVGGTGSSGAHEGFTYVTPATVTSVAPSEGSTNGGTKVVITGTHFESGSTVTIGAAATGVEIKSETEIVAKTAAHAAGATKVVVTLPDGVASEATKEFTYVAPPVISSISPPEGPTGGETVVKIKGTGFMKGSTLEIGSPALAFVVVSSTEIVAEVASHGAGKVPVVVSDKFGTANGPVEYTYVTQPAVVPGVVEGPAPAASPAAVSAPASAPAKPRSSLGALKLTATMAGGAVRVHVVSGGGAGEHVLVTVRLVRGRRLIAVLRHIVTIPASLQSTFKLKLPPGEVRAASILRAGAAYIEDPSVRSPGVTVALASGTHAAS